MNKLVSVLLSLLLLFDPFIITQLSFSEPISTAPIFLDVTKPKDSPRLCSFPLSAPLGADCGPKILQKILANLGKDVSLKELIQQTETQKGLTSLEGLKKGVEQHGLLALGVKTDTDTVLRLLERGVNVIAHFGGNNHYVWIQEINDRWVKGYNPAVRNVSWKIPRKVFDSVWKEEGLILWEAKLVDFQRTLIGVVTPIGLESSISPLTQTRIFQIRGGSGCANCSGGGGAIGGGGIVFGGDSGGGSGGTSTNEPVELSNGNLYQVVEDLNIPAVGPDLILERIYNAQIFSDIEGWQPEAGVGSWSVEDGTYAGAGDRSGTTDTWDDFIATLSMQTIEAGATYDYEVAWLNFRYQDGDNRYYFLIKTNGDLELTRVNSGTATNLASKASGYNPLNANTVKVEANGSNIKVWVNSTLEFDITDTNPITAAGPVKLESYFSHAHFDDVEITDITTSSTQSWNFSTDDNDGMFGRGWRASIETNLVLKANNDILVRRGNDRRDYYTWDVATSTWSSPAGIYDELSQVAGGYDLTQKAGTVYHFNTNGRLDSVEDRYGNTLTLSYTTVGGKERVSQMTESTGRSLTFSYDANGRCTQVTDPLSQTLSYSYNVDGLLESTSDFRGNTRAYQYDAHKRMTQYTNRNSDVYQYTYSYNNRVNTQTDAEGNVTSFDYQWDVTQVTDAGLNVWTYQFEISGGKGYLISKTDPEGNTTTYNWDSNRHLISQTDPNGNQVQFSYDSKGNKLTQTDPDGNVDSWTYEATYNQITSYTNKLDSTTTISYDANGNPTSIEDPLSNTQSMAYNTQGLMVTLTDKRGNTSTFSYDTNFYLQQVTDPLANTTTKTTDSGGRVTQVTDALGNATQYQYDDNNNLTQLTDPLSNVTSYTYDGNDNRTQITDPLSKITAFTYNAYNKVATKTDPLSRVTSYSYDKDRFMLTGAVDLTQVQDPAGGFTNYMRDKIGRATEEQNALGDSTSYQYDDVGNITQITDDNLNVTQYAYDSRDLLVTTTYADSTSETNIYDKNGNLIEETLRDGKSIIYSYNARNERIQRRVNSYNGIYLNWATWTVGDVGDPWLGDNFDLKVVMQTVDPGVDPWHTARVYFRHQDSDNLYYFLLKTDGGIELVRRKAGIQTWLETKLTSYDPEDLNDIQIWMNGSQIKIWINGNLEIDHTDSNPVTGDGNIILEGHASNDYFDNVHVKDLDTGVLDVWYATILDNYTYDENGNLTQIVRNGTETWTFTYDALNRLTQTTDSKSRTVQYQYDAVGRRTQLTYPSAMDITYTYDDSGRLLGVKEGATTYAAYAYNARSQRTSRTLVNGVISTYSYDDAGQLLSLVTKKGLTTLSSYTYTYDNLGNRTTQIDLTGTHSLTYDAISQLTDAVYPDSVTQAYTYDPVHNRTLLDISGTGTSYTVNNVNQVTLSQTGSNSISYSWDDRANITEKVDTSTTTTYIHNLLNQLTQVDQTGADSVLLEYDPLGRRIKKTVGTSIYHYTWAGDQLIEVRNDAGTLLWKFVYGSGIDEPVLIIDGATKYYYTHDGLGSISEISNSSGNIVEYYDYDVYGDPTLFNASGTEISSSTVDNPYYFTGREYDFETGLYYYRARYYDSEIGRFLETDPIGYFDSLNLYSYVFNNPWNYVDPLGLSGEKNGQTDFDKAKERAQDFSKDFKLLEKMYNKKPKIPGVPKKGPKAPKTPIGEAFKSTEAFVDYLERGATNDEISSNPSDYTSFDPFDIDKNQRSK